MDLKGAEQKIADDLKLPREVVHKAYHAYWAYIRNVVSSIPFKEGIADSDYDTYKTSVNIPSLGKLFCTLDRYHKMKDRYELLNKITDEYKED